MARAFTEVTSLKRVVAIAVFPCLHLSRKGLLPLISLDVERMSKDHS
jgi:hypothetical protein